MFFGDKQRSALVALAVTSALAFGGCAATSLAPAATIAPLPPPKAVETNAPSEQLTRGGQLSELKRLVERVDGVLGPSGVAYGYILFAQQVRRTQLTVPADATIPEPPRLAAARRRRSANERRPARSAEPLPDSDEPGLADKLATQGRPIWALSR